MLEPFLWIETADPMVVEDAIGQRSKKGTTAASRIQRSGGGPVDSLGGGQIEQTLGEHRRSVVGATSGPQPGRQKSSIQRTYEEGGLDCRKVLQGGGALPGETTVLER